MKYRGLLLLGAGLAMSGCASILSGTSETISFASNPPGANCDLVRNGKIIGSVTTPGGLVVEKTKHDINVTCKKEGYQDSTGFLKSGIQEETWGNIILGGGIGWAIDSAAGADNEYPDHITITSLSASPNWPGSAICSSISTASTITSRCCIRARHAKRWMPLPAMNG